MNRVDKFLLRFKSELNDFTWQEMERLLSQLGFQKSVGGKTGGSRCLFVHETAGIISLHKPHPDNILKLYVLREVKAKLEIEELI